MRRPSRKFSTSKNRLFVPNRSSVNSKVPIHRQIYGLLGVKDTLRRIRTTATHL